MCSVTKRNINIARRERFFANAALKGMQLNARKTNVCLSDDVVNLGFGIVFRFVSVYYYSERAYSDLLIGFFQMSYRRSIQICNERKI